jgi:hypothetical protein
MVAVALIEAQSGTSRRRVTMLENSRMPPALLAL